jgi:hypothetical protein
LQQGPWEDFCFRNVVPGRGGRRGVAKFRRCAAGFRPGRVGEGSRGPKGLVCGRRWVEKPPVRAGRRRPGGLAAVRLGPAGLRPGSGGGGAGKVVEGRVAQLGCLAGGGKAGVPRLAEELHGRSCVGLHRAAGCAGLRRAAAA